MSQLMKLLYVVLVVPFLMLVVALVLGCIMIVALVTYSNWKD